MAHLRMLDWQFDALKGDINSDKLPLIINIAGRFPGCSSEVALINDKIAPFYLDENGNPIKNNATWSKFYHIISVDFPYNTGYSYAAAPTDLKNSTDDAVEYLYTFLQKLGNKYPKWFSRDVYIIGENKAGHFAPVLASMILEKNSNSSNVNIPLKGIAINDPWISAKDQSEIFHWFGFDLGLLNIVQKEEIQNLENLILGNLSNNNYVDAYSSFELLISTFESYSNSYSHA